MTRFDEILNSLTQSQYTKNNFISDGNQQCSYQQLTDSLNKLQRYFSLQTIQQPNCIAFECNNTLPAALTLVFLFQQQQSFILLPPAGDQQKEPDFKASIPLFCDYKLTISTEKTANFQQPESFLRLEKLNIDNSPKPQLVTAQGKIYVRTSGSMGAAKIIVHSQQYLLNNAANYAQRYQLTSDDKVVIPVPIFHLYGLGAGFLSAFCTGASIRLLKRTNILSYLDMERKFQPNVAFFTPALCEMLLRGRKKSGGYRLVITSGDRIKDALFCDFDHKFGTLISQYGSTEMGAIAASNPTDSFQQRLKSTGKAMIGVQLAISSKGELKCKPQYGFEAYLDSHGQTLSNPVIDNWFTTGDLATINAAGEVTILGRADNQVNRSGFLVMLTDIEKKIEMITGVSQVIVLSIQEQEQYGRGQQLIAFCVLQKKSALNSQQIRSNCFNILPKYAIPDKIKTINQMPILVNGKIDRQALLNQME